VARWRKQAGAVPEQLARFVPAEWPGAGCPHEALRMWKHACADWLAADTGKQPRPGASADESRWWLAGGSRRALPFGEYGDAVDVIREAGRYRRSMPPCPAEYRPAQHW
jgi:hypothetical protein